MNRSVAAPIIFLTLLLVEASSAQWVQTAGPLGGSVPVILVDGTEIYAGTYEAGIFKSTDGGVSWEQKIAGFGRQTVVAMTKVGPHLLASGTEGLYRSTDGGDSWILIDDFSAVGGVSSLASQGTHAIAGTSYGGVYASSDTGTSWAPSNTGLPLADGETSVPAVLAAGSVYVMSGQDFTTNGVFLSTDLGANWSEADSGLPAGDLIRVLYYDGSTFYAAGQDLHRTTDPAGTWRSVGTGIPSFAMITGFMAHSGKIFAGGTAGLYSTNIGDSLWTRTSGRASEIGVMSLGSTGSAAVAGTSGDGIHRSTDGGITWAGSNAGLRARFTLGFLGDGSRLYSNGNSIFRTDDEGGSWSEIRGNLTDSARAPRLVYAGGSTLIAHDGSFYDHLIRSVDTGATWSEIWPDLYNIGMVHTIIRLGSDYWTAVGDVYTSTDAGTTWNAVPGALTPGGYLNGMALVGDTLFAIGTNVARSTDHGANWDDITPASYSFANAEGLGSAGGKLYIGDKYSGAVWSSTNGGSTWSPLPSPTGGGTVDQIYGAGGTLLLCSDFLGIFRSTNGGSAWTNFTFGLPADQSAYRVVAHDGYLFAGAGGNSVWRRPLSEVTAVGESEDGLPSTTALLQNYPNPFNPTTTLTWTAASTERITVRVYDVLGREAATLFDAVAEPGIHSAIWDAAGMPGGVYYVRMTSPSSTDMKAMLLVR